MPGEKRSEHQIIIENTIPIVTSGHRELPRLVSLERHDARGGPFKPLLPLPVILPLAGFAVLCAASWIASKREPKWGWILAGIYVVGFTLNLALPAVFRSSLILMGHGEAVLRMILLGLLPPFVSG